MILLHVLPATMDGFKVPLFIFLVVHEQGQEYTESIFTLLGTQYFEITFAIRPLPPSSDLD